MPPEYSALRGAVIYSDEAEMSRFRQLVVNSIIAMDIMDKELGVKRKARWNLAFGEEQTDETSADSGLNSVNRKATIVLEHLIQASGVSHAMQVRTKLPNVAQI